MPANGAPKNAKAPSGRSGGAGFDASLSRRSAQTHDAGTRQAGRGRRGGGEAVAHDEHGAVRALEMSTAAVAHAAQSRKCTCASRAQRTFFAEIVVMPIVVREAILDMNDLCEQSHFDVRDLARKCELISAE